MDDPNMTMEEYIKLEEEKARRHGRVFNCQTATYGKIKVDDDLYDLRSVEAEFPAIVIDDTVAPQDALHQYAFVSVTRANGQLFNDLDYFKDFENKFPAIVYNDALTSKSDFLTEPTLSPQHIDEFNLNDETSLSEYDEEGQNVICFNDLFPFNVIYPDELKTNTDNDNDKVDIDHSSGDMSVTPLSDELFLGEDATRAIPNMGFNLVDVEGVWFGFFLQMGFTLILATLDGLDVGLLGDVIGGDDCDDDE
ncbi:hypothetical protein Tco_1368012 [Tanacetum coccineum]